MGKQHIGCVLLLFLIFGCSADISASSATDLRDAINGALRLPGVQDRLLRSGMVMRVASAVVGAMNSNSSNCSLSFNHPPEASVLKSKQDVDLRIMWTLGIECASPGDDVYVAGDTGLTVNATTILLQDLQIRSVISSRSHVDTAEVLNKLNSSALLDFSSHKLSRNILQLAEMLLGTNLTILSSQSLVQSAASSSATQIMTSLLQSHLARIGNGKGLSAISSVAKIPLLPLSYLGFNTGKMVNCISGEALAQLEVQKEGVSIHRHRQLRELQVGDLVKVADGKLDRVFYASCAAGANFAVVRVVTRQGRELELTPQHLVLRLTPTGHAFVPAHSLSIGDKLATTLNSSPSPFDEISLVYLDTATSVCNIKTTSGSIIVNDIVASTSATSHVGAQMMWLPVQALSTLSPRLVSSHVFKTAVDLVSTQFERLYHFASEWGVADGSQWSASTGFEEVRPSVMVAVLNSKVDL